MNKITMTEEQYTEMVFDTVSGENICLKESVKDAIRLGYIQKTPLKELIDAYKALFDLKGVVASEAIDLIKAAEKQLKELMGK